MRMTKIRNAEGKKLEARQLEALRNELARAIEADHFITGVYVINGTRIDTGLHMKSFTIDTSILPKNARVGGHCSSIKGYKRTNLPTWEQREQHNHTINDVLDKFGVKANVKSGSYEVRDFDTGRVNHWYEDRGWNNAEVMTETEARECCDSDRLEAEHKAKMYAIRNKARIEKKLEREEKRWLK